MTQQSNTASQTEGVKWGPLRLLPGISKGNASVFILGFVFTMLFATFVPQAQPFILTEILRIPAEQQGQVSGYLGLAQTIVGLIMPSIWGTISDKNGRRLVYGIGFLLAATGIILYPLAGTLVALFIFRMIFAAGSNAATTMSNALTGDYIDQKDRGKAVGLTSMAGGIGALLTVFLFLRLPSMFQNGGSSAVSAGRFTYWIVAGIGLIATLLVWLGLKGKTATQSDEKRKGMQIAREALAAAAADPGISLAYGVNFAASGAVTAIGTFFTLWIVTYGTVQGGLTSAEALAKAGMIMGISQIMGLIASPIFGVLSDKIGRVRAVILSATLTAIAFAATLLIANPLNNIMIVLGLCLGFTQISGLITGGSLVTKQAPESVRGAVMGFYGFCGALGIMLAFLLGGWLFDHWMYQGPFVLAAVLCACVAVWAVLVNKKIK
jgi:MFS family permease